MKPPRGKPRGILKRISGTRRSNRFGVFSQGSHFLKRFEFLGVLGTFDRLGIEAGLAFVGISDPDMVSWGMMMREALGFTYLNVWLWWLLPAGVALSLTIIAITFIGHTLEPAMDPRLRGEASA